MPQGGVVTLDEVTEADKRFQEAAERAEGLRQERNNLIRLAVSDGVSVTAVARALGCSRARVYQIIEQE